MLDMPLIGYKITKFIEFLFFRIYESNYDGSCLRNVSSAVRNRRNLYFHDDLLHFLHENSMDQSSLMKMDVKNGEESIVKKFNYHVSGFGIFSNDESKFHLF